MQSDLFAPALLPGLSTCAEILSADEEAALLEGLGRLPLAPFQFHGWQGRRQVVSFGWRYDFNDASFARTEPIPGLLLPLRARIAALADLPEKEFAQSLVARYDPGAGIGWHRDRPVFETVGGVSLASDATLRFRRRRPGGFDRFALPAPARGAYLLAGEARWDWEHSLAPLHETRWSVTFRTLSGRGRKLVAATPCNPARSSAHSRSSSTS